MRIPNTIKIGAYTIPVYKVKGLMTSDSARGQYHCHNNTIEIDPSLSQQQQFSVFIHECIEAINDCYDTNLKEHQILILEQEVTQLIEQLMENTNDEIHN